MNEYIEKSVSGGSNPSLSAAEEKKEADGYKDDEDLEKEEFSSYEDLLLPQEKNVDYSYNFTRWKKRMEN